MKTRLLFAMSINRIAFATIFLFVPLWVSAQDYFYYSNQQTQVAQAQDAPFITVWKTDNRGASSQDNQIIIYGEGENYTIEWEEVDHPLSVENYDKTLIGWSGQELTPGLALGADSLRYCQSAEQRQYIIDQFEWSINDAGMDDDCNDVSTEDQARLFEFQLKQNYPNPFNPSTRIRYTLAEPSHVRLEIFDLAGRRVAFPVDGFQTAGRHDIMFDASELAGGAYLYRLSTGTTSASKIMMLIK